MDTNVNNYYKFLLVLSFNLNQKAFFIRMNIFKKVFRFYYEGFRDMPKWGRQMWLIIIIKGVLVFILVKFIFFPNYLKTNFSTDQQRSEHVVNELIKNAENDTTTTKH